MSPAKKVLKKLDFGLDILGSHQWSSGIDWEYLETELAYKLKYKKNAYGSWDYSNYPEFEFYSLGDYILVVDKNDNYEGYSSFDFYVLRDETELESEAREKRQSKEEEKAALKKAQTRESNKLAKEQRITEAKEALEKAGYKVTK